MLSALTTAPVSRKSAICSAICSATFSCASVVAAPRCGVATTLSRPNSGFLRAGSSTKTSIAAPATWPLSSAAARSSSTTSPPRAQLMRRTPRFILAMARGVDDVVGGIGQRRVQGDEIGAGEAARRAPPSRRRDRRRARATGTGRRRRPSSSGPGRASATIEPILPQPMTPSVLPVSSTPMKRDFSHLPAWVERSAAGICRPARTSSRSRARRR